MIYCLYRLLAKAGVKVSPNELAARASPTAPRRSDLPKLDSSLLHNMQQQQFPLPASMPPASVAAVGKFLISVTGIYPFMIFASMRFEISGKRGRRKGFSINFLLPKFFWGSKSSWYNITTVPSTCFNATYPSASFLFSYPEVTPSRSDQLIESLNMWKEDKKE